MMSSMQLPVVSACRYLEVCEALRSGRLQDIVTTASVAKRSVKISSRIDPPLHAGEHQILWN
jgi:hypothetical protein